MKQNQNPVVCVASVVAERICQCHQAAMTWQSLQEQWQSSLRSTRAVKSEMVYTLQIVMVMNQ